jgi:hypothetical protein
MRLFRHLQHWLTGSGTRLQVADFVPKTHPLRQWAETFPWVALVAAIDRRFAQRCPTDSTRGRPPGEWPPLRQAAFSMAGSDTDVPEAVAPSRPRLSHCWASQPLQS